MNKKILNKPQVLSTSVKLNPNIKRIINDIKKDLLYKKNELLYKQNDLLYKQNEDIKVSKYNFYIEDKDAKHPKFEYITNSLISNRENLLEDYVKEAFSLGKKNVKTPKTSLTTREKRLLPFLNYNKYYENLICQNYYIKNYFMSNAGIELDNDIKDFFLFENLKNADEITDYVKIDNKSLAKVHRKKKNFLSFGCSLYSKSFMFKFRKNHTIFFELNIPGVNKKLKPNMFSFNKVLNSLETFSKNINKFKAFLLLIKPLRNCFLCLYNGIIGSIRTKELKDFIGAYTKKNLIETKKQFLIRIPFLYINASFYSAYYKRRVGKRFFFKKFLRRSLKKTQIEKKKRQRKTIKFYFYLSKFLTKKELIRKNKRIKRIKNSFLSNKIK